MIIEIKETELNNKIVLYVQFIFNIRVHGVNV